MITGTYQKQNIKKYDFKTVYEIKNKDISKQIFCEDTYISKQYQKAINNNSLVLKELFNID